ncbi:MAG: integrase core domain-containing protein [Marinobacter sp.]
MSRKGNPLDNAAMESYFHMLKAELVNKRLFDTKVQAVSEIIHHMMFDNRVNKSERLHSSLGYQSPEEYEKLSA